MWRLFFLESTQNQIIPTEIKMGEGLHPLGENTLQTAQVFKQSWVCLCVDGRECDDAGVRQRGESVWHGRGLCFREVRACLTVGSQEERCCRVAVWLLLSVSQGWEDPGKHPEKERVEVYLSHASILKWSTTVLHWNSFRLFRRVSCALPVVVTMCTCVQGCVVTFLLVLGFGSCFLSGKHMHRFSLTTATHRENVMCLLLSLFFFFFSRFLSFLQEVKLRCHHQDLLGWTVSPSTTTKKNRFTLATQQKPSPFVCMQSGDRTRTVTETHHWRWTAILH